MGRILIIVGSLLVLAGLLITVGEKLPLKIGRLPGDIVIRGKNSVFYFPLATSILISIVLSAIMWLLSKRS